MFEGGMGRKLSTLFGKTPQEKAAALVFQLPGEKARGKLAELKADAVPALLALLRGTAEGGVAGANDEMRKEMRRAAAELVIRAGAPALSFLRPLIRSDEKDDRRLGYLLARKMLMRALETPGSEEAEKKAAGAEVMSMMEGANVDEVVLGIEFAAKVQVPGVASMLGRLASNGWNDAIRDLCNSRIAEMVEIRALVVHDTEKKKVDINTRKLKGNVPESDLLRFLVPGDRVAVADELIDSYNGIDNILRGQLKSNAVEALGKLGTVDAVVELLKVLDGYAYDPGLMSPASEDMQIAKALRAAVGKRPALVHLIAEEIGRWNATEKAEIEKVGQTADSPAREKATHVSKLLSGVI